MTASSNTSRAATAQEWMVWRRLASDPADPGLVLSYVFALPEGVGLDRLSAALASLVTDFQPGLLLRFFLKGYALRVRTAPACGDPLARGGDEWPFGTRPVIDPRTGALYRFETRRDDRGGTLLRLSFSHLILDGRGYALVRRDLDRAYRGTAPVPAARAGDGPAVTDEALAYWRRHLDGTSLSQPLAFLRRPTAADATREVDAETFTCPYGADWFSRGRGRAFPFVCAATALLVWRYNHSFGEDGPVRIAYTVGLGDGGTAGTHANVAPLIVAPQATMPAAEFLQGIRIDRRHSRPHQHVPFADIAATAGRADGPPANLVVNHSPGLLPAEGLSLDGLDCPLVRGPEAGGPYDFAVVYDVRADHLAVRLEVRRGAASPETRAALVRAWRQCLDFLAEAAEGGTRTLGDLDLSRPARAVAAGPARETPRLDPRRRIAAFAAADPDRVAIGDRSGTTSYGALLGQVDALARRLARLPEARRQAGVAFVLPRDRALPVAYLAAIEAGIRFAPVDPALPDPTIRSVFEVSGIRTVLTTRKTASRLDPLSDTFDLDRIDLEDHLAHAGADGGTPASGARDDAADAYLMFTSGSTGVPKGVAVTRRNLSNFLQAMADFAFAEEGSRWLALTAVGFDISILELLLPLTCGGSVYVADEETRISARSIARCIDDWRIDTLQATPSTFEMLRRDGWRARRPLALLCGGEALSEPLAGFLLGQSHGLFNVYGPTEATIWATCAAVASARDTSIGGPLDNTCLHVCDPDGRAVPCGMAGELVLSGAQVGRGYLNAPNAPAYGEDPAGSGERAYRTGDRVVHRGAGRLDFLGRLDDQIKLSGHRIELGEVRAAVAAAGASAFCVLRRTPNDHIACFVGPGQPDGFDVAALRARVHEILPEWKRPSHYHRLSAVPLTPNGKTDLKRLAGAPLADLPILDPPPRASEAPEVDGPAPCAAPDAPADLPLAALIEAATGRSLVDPTVSLVDNGFGSLDFNRLSASIESASGIVLPPHRFFAFRDLRALEQAIVQAGGATPHPAHASATPEPDRVPGASAAGGDRVAIIGMSGRGPGGLDIDGLMQAYDEGRSLIRPGDRLAGRDARAGFIDDVETFDARFFGISPVEAKHMDPRQRILLEECWRCLEDANVLPRDLTGARVGCYVGVTGSDFTTLSERAGVASHPYALSGAAASIVANRISSFFDWRGPSMAIDTACSSGLSALVRAVSDLAAGLCEQAFVASANLVLDERLDAALEAGGFLSKSGRCSAFRDEADGYVRADGVFGIFLKPLPRALADGNSVRAVIRAAEDGHGGRAASLTAPSSDAQAALLARAWRDGIGDAIGYIETHGTGTRLGDPIEIDGLQGAMACVAPERSDAVYLGALKANAGHAEASAGLAGLAKVVRILETGRIPPNRAPGALNPYIDVSVGPFRFPDRTIAFPSQEHDAGRGRCVAGVSSFGFGGSNAHVVLEAWPAGTEEETGTAPNRDASRTEPCLVVLSARSPQALRRQAERLADAIEDEPTACLAAVARTLAFHRTHFEYRAAFVAPSREALSRWLRSPFEIAEPGRPATGPAVQPAHEPAHEPDRVGTAEVAATGSGHDPERDARAFLAGEPVDFGPLFRPRADRSEPRAYRLPGYAFDRDQVFPLPRLPRSAADLPASTPGEPARDEAPYLLTGGGSRRVEIRLASARRLLSRHRVNGSGLLPGVASLLLAEEAFRRLHPSSSPRLVLCDIGWPLAIGTDDLEAPIVVETGTVDRGSTFTMSISGDERLFGTVPGTSTRIPRFASDFTNWERRQWTLEQAVPIDVAALYRRFTAQGIDYDGEFRCLERIERSGTRCRAVLKRRTPDWNGLVGLLDGALQSGLALSADDMGGALMPFSLGALIWHRPARTVGAGVFHAMTMRSSRFRTQIQLCDSRLQPVAAFVDLGVRPKPAAAGVPAPSATTHLETAS